MFTGLTVATIGGVPLATWAGEILGWRSAFAGIAVIGAVAMLALRLALPSLAVSGGGDMRVELRVLARGPVLAALALTVVGASAMFTVFTYIVPILREQTHAATGFVTAMLMLYGIGLTIGNALGGRFADRSIDRTLVASFTVLAVVLVAFAGVMRWPVPTAIAILVWGVASFAIVPPLQMRVMQAAADALNERYGRETAVFHHVPEFYNHSLVRQYMQEELGIPEEMEYQASSGSDGIHEELSIDAIMSVIDPSSIRFDQRVAADRASINGIPLEPLSELQDLGRALIEYRTMLTVEAIEAFRAGSGR